MAALHSALHSLRPVSFSEIPTKPEELDEYLSKLFADCQSILESVPIGPSDESQARPRSQTASSIASNASEISASSARSAPASAEHTALQKEWGKPIKLSAKENPLGMSVYKTSGKDGHGAWFARRSVHEGLGFAKFKSGLQREFPESLAAGSAPGEGNIRGIGGERKVEDKDVKGKGRVQLWQLSAQFPGPTTPRDFVTLLITSSKAIKEAHDSKIREITPRHYMIISKPCDHPETPPRTGYIRGKYESVEFIREVPRQPSKSGPSTGAHNGSGYGHDSTSLEKDLLRRNAQKIDSFPLNHENRSTDSLGQKQQVRFDLQSQSHDTSPDPRRRSATVGDPEGHAGQDHSTTHFDAEENPVEWIMITRSDPGGSVPRFMVERGTPGSIVADASKFLDWACQKDDPVQEPETPAMERPSQPQRRESFASWQANGVLAGIDESQRTIETYNKSAGGDKEAFPEIPSPDQDAGSKSPATIGNTQPTEVPERNQDHPLASSGILASVSGALSAYTPQAVLDRLPASIHDPKNASSPALLSSSEETPRATETRDRSATDATGFTATTAATDSTDHDDDAASETSTLTFASADSHLGDSDPETPSVSSKTTPKEDNGSTKSPRPKGQTPEEKEEANFAKRKAALDKKLADAKEKYAKDQKTEAEKVKKVEEKHKMEVEKEEQRLRKQLAKAEEKRLKEEKKEEDKKRKEAEKDEKVKLTRERDEAKKERDEARGELETGKKQVELMMRQIGDLQKENTMLTARIGKLESGEGGFVEGVMKLKSEERTVEGRSRSSSLRRVLAGDPH